MGDFTDNEMAKLHVRYMVGGHAPQAENERLIRFEFPERPGALLRFPDPYWPTLEHQPVSLRVIMVRAYGRVLVGIQGYA